MRAEPAPNDEEDFYLEGKALVFTAQYHLRRGYCCESGCRHCPFGYDMNGKVKDEEREVE